MKKTLLITTCFLSFMTVIAQTNSKQENTVTEHYQKYEKSGDVSPVDLKKAKVKVPTANNDKGVGQTVLGLTDYDLQTNGSTQDRIIMDDNGNISAVWTASEVSNSSFDDRGTGYSFYDGTSWTQSPDYPRIESIRTGWPSILYAGSGEEIVISHSTTSGNRLKFNSRSTKGSGNWTEKDVSTRHLTWQRSAMGGTDGNTLHLFALTDTLDSADFQNMRRALVYYRSQDGGSTFDIQERLIPGLDTPSVSIVGADDYAIAANGNVVAVAIFRGLANDVFILKSTDNGDTWTKTVVYDFPYADFDDFDLNFAIDDTNAVMACDGSGAILLDDNDNVHVTFGRLLMTNDTVLGNGIYTRTIFVDSLVYWNETMGANNYTLAGHIFDADENGNPNLAAEFINLGDYRLDNIISQPTMGLGDDGKIWVAYSALTEDFTDQSSPETNLRHIFIMNSDDGGSTWSDPVDLNIFNEFSECVYPSMVKTVDDKIRLIYQRDERPSVVLVTNSTFARHTNQTTVTSNEIVYYEISTALNVGIDDVPNPLNTFEVFPNPANDAFKVALNLDKPARVNVSVFSILGNEVLNIEQDLSSGQRVLPLDASEFPSGIYLVTVLIDGQQFTKKLTVN